MMTRTVGLLWIVVALTPRPAAGQQGDTVRIADLHSAAVRRDPRGEQSQLLASQSRLRLSNLSAERMPVLSVNGQAQYQSAVASVPFNLPGVPLRSPHKDTYDAYVGARQKLFDPALAGRRDVERAQLAESQARVQSSLFALRQNVNDAYFMALDLQSRSREVEVVITDLEAQYAVASARVKEGAALPSEARILEAELLRRRQSLTALTSEMNAALAVLSDLTGISITEGTPLHAPDLAESVSKARAAIDQVRSRPEFEQFALSREVLGRQRAVVSARDLPRLVAFGRGGYGRPGLNPLAGEFDTYWLMGVQLEWNPWSWGATRRDREVLSLQQQIVEREASAFAHAIRRSVVRDLASIDRLEGALAEDQAIIELREAVLREARARYREGVITSAEYVDRQTDVLAARLALSSDRVELAQARARFLTTLGLEVR
jgi:outer membrane protein TolC